MKTGIVVIGRNEGLRLLACLRSLPTSKSQLVYVDSGSSDGSPQLATELGAHVIALDMSVPFTAARARTVGMNRLLGSSPDLKYVQFVDGDCVIVDGWLEAGEAFLDERDDVGVVCGGVREVHPDASIYNGLCDIEWDTPVGETDWCGGIAMMRISAVHSVSGFRGDLIAGEEPELCLRLRENGWRIWRLANDMALHDADIRRFGEWWTRGVRGGFAYAEVFSLHIGSPKRIWGRELLRAAIWGLVLPTVVILAGTLHIATFGLLLLYPLQIARIAARRGSGDATSWLYGTAMVVNKFAEAWGALKYLVRQLTRSEIRIIEYK